MGLAPGLLAGLYMLVSVLTQPRPQADVGHFEQILGNIVQRLAIAGRTLIRRFQALATLKAAP